MGWSDERVEMLKRLWLDGLSCSQIAKQLGGVTRNSVIGKVHRLGLSGRSSPTVPGVPRVTAARPPRPPRPSRPIRVTPPPLPVLIYDEEQPGAATTLTLGADMCKWPIGDPQHDNFTFCGRAAFVCTDGAKRSYCGEHCRLAYQPPRATARSGSSELARSLRRYL